MSLLKITTSNNDVIYTTNVDHPELYTYLGNVSVIDDNYDGLIYCYTAGEFCGLRYIEFRNRLKSVYQGIGEDDRFLLQLCEHKIVPYNRIVEIFNNDTTTINNIMNNYDNRMREIRRNILQSVYTFLKNEANIFNGNDYKISSIYSDILSAYLNFEIMDVYFLLKKIYGSNPAIEQLNYGNFNGDPFYIANKTYLKLILSNIPYQNTTLLAFLDSYASSDIQFNIFWNNISWIYSNHPLVVQLKGSLGISDTDFDGIFLNSIQLHLSNA